jgi:1-acyl-sn-glycerol-3-phosphate acyltransferase
MQPIITDQPYEFVPPYHGVFWPKVLKLIVPGYLRRTHGVVDTEIRDIDKLAVHVKAGHGVLIAPNHCRMADPLVMQMLSKQLGRNFFVMASSHLFYRNRLRAWLIRRSGGFSVYREGVDRESVRAAIDILDRGSRPLVIFPEGSLSHANDRLNALMAGVPLIARAAARKAEKSSKDQGAGRIVVVPVAIKYLFGGDVRREVEPMLDEIETRLSWRVQSRLPLLERIYKLGHALLTLKEMEFLGQPGEGSADERLKRLIDNLLEPLETKWLDGRPKDSVTASVISRVKELRRAVLPEMIAGELAEVEWKTRWRVLEDMHLAQQLSLYPPKYVATNPTTDRLLETVVRFSDHLGGKERPHPPIRAVVQVGDAIDVEPERRRDPGGDPLLSGIEQQLQSMLDTLSDESTKFDDA